MAEEVLGSVSIEVVRRRGKLLPITSALMPDGSSAVDLSVVELTMATLGDLLEKFTTHPVFDGGR
jgi:hypothetical protein